MFLEGPHISFQTSFFPISTVFVVFSFWPDVLCLGKELWDIGDSVHQHSYGDF